MSVHTPGPWRIGKTCGAVVADTPHGIYHEAHDEFYGGHLIAESIEFNNRPIIAAAPELLEALEESHNLLLEFYEQWKECEGEEEPPGMADLARTLQLNAKLLAKVKEVPK